MNNPLIYVSIILGVVTIICLVAFLTIKDKKEAFGFDRNMKDGEINYVGATAFNNGVTAKIGNTEHLHPANTITVCYNGSIGQTFFQTEPYWATDDVNVLYPKFNITPNIAKYLCAVIYKLGFKYAYADKWTADKMSKTRIKLPATPDKSPDWAYMEQYMQNLENKAKGDISLIISILGGVKSD